MNDITIRLAVAGDVPTLQRLLVDLAGELGKTDDVKGTEACLSRFGFSGKPFFQAMLAFSGEEAIGLVVFFSEYSTWRGEPGVYIQDLYVSRAARGEGLGRRLLEAVKTEASRWGARYMKLTVYDRNPDAIAFYRSLGFELREDELPLVLREF